MYTLAQPLTLAARRAREAHSNCFTIFSALLNQFSQLQRLVSRSVFNVWVSVPEVAHSCVQLDDGGVWTQPLCTSTRRMGQGEPSDLIGNDFMLDKSLAFLAQGKPASVRSH